MSENQLNGFLGVTMDKIKEMVDVNTVIGDPIPTQDGTTVIPTRPQTKLFHLSLPGLVQSSGIFPQVRRQQRCYLQPAGRRIVSCHGHVTSFFFRV